MERIAPNRCSTPEGQGRNSDSVAGPAHLRVVLKEIERYERGGHAREEVWGELCTDDAQLKNILVDANVEFGFDPYRDTRGSG